MRRDSKSPRRTKNTTRSEFTMRSIFSTAGSFGHEWAHEWVHEWPHESAHESPHEHPRGPISLFSALQGLPTKHPTKVSTEGPTSGRSGFTCPVFTCSVLCEVEESKLTPTHNFVGVSDVFPLFGSGGELGKGGGVREGSGGGGGSLRVLSATGFVNEFPRFRRKISAKTRLISAKIS